jgi:hypothetical protein
LSQVIASGVPCFAISASSAAAASAEQNPGRARISGLREFSGFARIE